MTSKKKKKKNLKLKVCLRSAYFAKIENYFLKILQIKVKVNWNSIVRPMNSTKKCNETHE